MKKFFRKLAAVLLAVAIMSVGLPFMAYADPFSEIYTEGIFRYVLEDDGAWIMECTADSISELIIPEQLGGCNVVGFSWVFGDLCTSVEKIELPDTIEYVDSDAFRSTKFYQDKSNWKDNTLVIGDWLIGVKYDFDVDSEIYSIPNGIKNIAQNAFDNCEGITTINIPASVLNICCGNGFPSVMFDIESLEKIIVDGKNSAYSSDDNGILYNKDKSELIRCPKNNKIQAFTIPSTVNVIKDFAFSKCNQLRSVVIPDSVTDIGIEAFENCKRLSTVALGKGLKEIKGDVFFGCEYMKEISIPSNVDYIEYSTFLYCDMETAEDYPFGNLTITCEEGSCAYNYAVEYGIKYKLLSSEHEHDWSFWAKESETTIYRTCSLCNKIEKSSIPETPILYLDIVDETPDYVTLMISVEGSVNALDTQIFALSEKTKQTAVSDDTTELKRFSGCLFASNINNGRFSCFFTSFYNGPLISYTFEKNSSEKITKNDFNLVCSNCCYTGYNDKGEIVDIAVHPKIVNRLPDKKPQHKHTFTYVEIPATCTVNGMAYDICEECGETANSEVLYATGHNWGDWVTVVEATSETDGRAERKCSNCNEIEFKILPKINVIKDDKTGVEIEYCDEFGKNVAIEVEEVFDGTSIQLINTEFGNVNTAVFDISTKQDGVKVQPSGSVKVRIPVPKNFGSGKIFAVYVDSEKGTVTQIPVEVVDGFAEFVVEHFSYYALVCEKANVKSVTMNDIELQYKKQVQLKPEIKCDNGAKYKTEYKSSNSSVVRVDDNGNLYGAKRGTASVTCTVTDSNGNKVSDTCTVKVKYVWWQWIIKIVLFGWIWY